MVRARENGAIYAMKTMRKEAMLMKNQVRSELILSTALSGQYLLHIPNNTSSLINHDNLLSNA